jgi:Fe-S-cluster-containing hydrogenase component 2
MNMRLRPAVEVAKCNGCKACELACSLRLKGCFDSNGSAIRVIRPDIHGPIRFEVMEDCDLCNGIEVPSCIEFCASDAISLIESSSGRNCLN